MRAAVVAASVTLALSSCVPGNGPQPSVSPQDSLVDLGREIAICASVGGSRPTSTEKANRHFVYEHGIQLDGTTPALIKTVTFAITQGLEVVSVRLLTDPPPTSIGWVPYESRGPLWDKTVPAQGAELPPGHSFLEFEVKYLGPGEAKLGGTTVVYAIGEAEFRATSESSLTLATSEDGC